MVLDPARLGDVIRPGGVLLQKLVLSEPGEVKMVVLRVIDQVRLHPLVVIRLPPTFWS